MRNISKTAIALTIAATALVSAISPSLAQVNGSRSQSPYHDQSQSQTYEVPRDRGANNG